MSVIRHLRSAAIRLKLRLMIDDAADLRSSLAIVPRGSDAWIILKEQRRLVDEEIRAAGDRLFFLGYKIPDPMSRLEMAAIGAVIVAVGIVALNIAFALGPL